MCRLQIPQEARPASPPGEQACRDGGVGSRTPDESCRPRVSMRGRRPAEVAERVNAGDPLLRIFADMPERGRAAATLPAPARESDPPSFEEFFLEHRVPLFRALWLIVRNRQEAEEIMQEAFVRVLER